MKENTDEEMPSDEAIEAEQELMREKLNRRKAEILQGFQTRKFECLNLLINHKALLD